MMDTANTRGLNNRTLAVIDGGLNLRGHVQMLSNTSKPKLLDQVRQTIRTRHYSDRTEKAYVHWIKRYIFFHNKRHPQEMAEAEIAGFLSSLATVGRLALPHRTTPLTHSCFSITKCEQKRSDLSKALCAQRGRSGCRSCSPKTKSKK